MGAIKGKKLESIVCPVCSYSTKRVTNFEQHLVDQHGKSPEDLWVELYGIVTCKCGCGAATKWLGWKGGYSQFVNGHNASLYNYMSSEAASEITQRRRDKLRQSIEAGEVIPWNKGLNKEDSEVLASAAEKRSATMIQQFSSGQRTAWCKGLQKNSDQRLVDLSNKLKEKFSSGVLTPWCKGLTKDSDQRIKNMATRVSLSLRRDGLRKRLDQYKRLKEDEIRSRIESDSNLSIVSGLEQYINDASPVIKVQCNKCGSQFHDSLRRLQRGRCYVCQPAGSAAQQEISDYLESLGLEITRNDRSTLQGMELDIYLPVHKFAIEYNGLYWHSDLHKSSTYHENKSKMARSLGLQLIHIFEDDWRDRRDTVKSMMLHRLKLTPRKIGARSLVIKKLGTLERRQFFELNHIDGDVSSVVAWGLFSGDELLSALSVRKPFHKAHSGYYEIARFCTKNYCAVNGALQRLTKVALRFAIANSRLGLMTYVDNRFGHGNGYLACGFQKMSETPPRFWWTDFESRFNRFKFKADPERGLTELDVAAEVGVVKIWGCSNTVLRITC